MKKALFAAAFAVAVSGAGLTIPAYAQMADAPNSRGHGDQMGQGDMNGHDMHQGRAMSHHGSMMRHHRHCRMVWRHHHRVRVCR